MTTDGKTGPPDEAAKLLALPGVRAVFQDENGSWQPLFDSAEVEGLRKRVLGTVEGRAKGTAKGHETSQRRRKAWLAYAKSCKRAWLKFEPDLTQKDIIDKLLALRLWGEDEPELTWPKTVTRRPGRSSLEKAKELWDE
jgi:hypothetical protein